MSDKLIDKFLSFMMAALTDQPAVLVPRILISSHFDVPHETLCQFSFNTFQGCTKICVLRSNTRLMPTNYHDGMFSIWERQWATQECWRWGWRGRGNWPTRSERNHSNSTCFKVGVKYYLMPINFHDKTFLAWDQVRSTCCWEALSSL